jgi:endonuclease/exonuclease/phosphatase family metal-dependent hydrolase
LAIKPDILLVEEITSLPVLEAVRDAMGLHGFHVACSDFSPEDKPDYSDFEVGIISRWPLNQVIEYDPSPDATTEAGLSTEEVLNPELKLGVRKPPGDVRGYLWARIDAVKLTVSVVHLKSSRGSAGPDDFENARKREFVAAAVAVGVLDDRQFWPEYNCVVAGDFNVGHSDKGKNGHDLFHDTDGPANDGYDDTHAMFADGIVGGLRMNNLVLHSTKPTYPGMPGTPIDNIYVVGPQLSSFKPAIVEESTFSSDHRPVWTSVNLKVNAKAALPTLAAGHRSVPKPVITVNEGIIAAKEASQHLNQRCTIEFAVNGGSMLEGRNLCFLNSMSDFRNKENFTAVLRQSAIKDFAGRGIEDPAKELRGKKVRVTGVITLRNGQCQVEIDRADEVQLVNST